MTQRGYCVGPAELVVCPFYISLYSDNIVFKYVNSIYNKCPELNSLGDVWMIKVGRDKGLIRNLEKTNSIKRREYQVMLI